MPHRRSGRAAGTSGAPGRALARDRDGAGDLAVGEARKVVEAAIVLAHVVEAVAMILPFEPAALRCRVETRLAAPFPLAFRAGIAQQTVLVGLDAEAVEEF